MIFRFGPFELDAHLFALRRGGEPIALQPRVFDLLLYFVQRRDVVVTRAELLESVWGGVKVTKDALAQAVMALRRALGDDGETPVYIDTVRGRGYRFIAPVTSAEPPTRSSAEGMSPFIGRDEPMAQVLSRMGRGGIVLVTGDAGVGKTRFLEELGSRATGVRVVRAYAAPEAPDLWPATEVLRDLRRGGAPLGPELRALVDGTLDPTTLDDPRTQFGLLDAILDFLGRAPTLILIDDLHRASPRAHVFGGLAIPRLRSRPVLACVTYTQSACHPPSFQEYIATASRDPAGAVIRLEPFARGEVATFLQAAGGVTPSEELVTKIHEKTRGNPLLLANVVSTRSSQEWLRAPEVRTGSLVDADTLRETIGHQLRGLSPTITRVLSMAAVFGRTFSVAPLSAALGLPNAEVLAALDAACAERVVCAIETGTYRFAYPLVQDVLHAQLPSLERARLHGLAAKALELHLGASEDHERVGEIARHLAEAAAIGDVDMAIEWAIRAADLANAAGNRVAASRYAERGLVALGFAQRPDQDKRARLEARAETRPQAPCR
jgi:DNA-binding winged helix-turn-helix (wHTH) protein